MEGLIPFVIHAIKKKRERSHYRCLSEGSTGHGGSRKPLVADWPQENSSHHRRTRSDFPPSTTGSEYFSSHSQFAPSRSMREDAHRK
ncbi:hypothetical protein COCNU_13G006990 [Cocos nucifera]|uniref:Uncharacterized protein n=1 Tax=Cocos nucifera TaxID=13894 RepID=A0A8K0IUY8_COCNU|nr:hypothetical protein COCNU_13G006990 [Cocos nucifera]